MSEEIKENLTNTGNWLRLLLTVIYALIFTLGIWVLGFVVLLSLLVLLFTGERNRNLVEFGGQLAAYLGQIMSYATLNSDDQPFPFGEWSRPAEAGTQPAPAPKAADQPPAPAAKAAPKKKAASKKVGKKAASKGQD